MEAWGPGRRPSSRPRSRGQHLERGASRPNDAGESDRSPFKGRSTATSAPPRARRPAPSRQRALPAFGNSARRIRRSQRPLTNGAHNRFRGRGHPRRSPTLTDRRRSGHRLRPDPVRPPEGGPTTPQPVRAIRGSARRSNATLRVAPSHRPDPGAPPRSIANDRPGWVRRAALSNAAPDGGPSPALSPRSRGAAYAAPRRLQYGHSSSVLPSCQVRTPKFSRMPVRSCVWLGLAQPGRFGA